MTNTKGLQSLDASHELVIASVEKAFSLEDMMDSLSPTRFDVVIVDDANQYPAETMQRLEKHFANSKVVFLSVQ